TSLTSFFSVPRATRDLHSFPTRRSSDLGVHQLADPDLDLDIGDLVGHHGNRRDQGQNLTQAGLVGRRDPLHSLQIHLLELLQQRSEEHTSELQSLAYLVCRLLLEKKNKP